MSGDNWKFGKFDSDKNIFDISVVTNVFGKLTNTYVYVHGCIPNITYICISNNICKSLFIIADVYGVYGAKYKEK